MHPLDALFAQMAEACREYLERHDQAKPKPTETTDESADRLVDAFHKVEHAVDRVDSFVAAA